MVQWKCRLGCILWVFIPFNWNLYVTIYEVWRFPEMVVPPNHPFIDGIFHEINHPFGVAPLMESHLWKPPIWLREI